ncbi:MAG: type II/IV secretion system ATPase subunit [Candidatus Nanoarchaeia archaeon]|jgi:type IV secretory pathway ATPase VirB11/archaellum biosynthesis ATPase|nr:type II/IV secretion system ATPase subunit [Candidatus Nanoarchaeia archaeon]|tara:strand:- start:3374 stop:5635 length:2262 start_codon:yes stop_codon:yes gene_type:complete
MAEDYQVLKEGREDVLRINAEQWSFVPSLENNAVVMAKTIDYLVQVPSTGRIVFTQKRNYSYNYEQTQMLVEIANLYKMLVKQKRILTLADLASKPQSNVFLPEWQSKLQEVVINLLRADPLGAYVELRRLIREEKIKIKKVPLDLVDSQQSYIDTLAYLYNLLDKTRLINIARKNLSGYAIGNREIYSTIFRPIITPDFMFTRLMAQHPLDGEQLDLYSFGQSEVNIYSTEKDIKYLYHLIPPEFKLTEDKYELLDLARGVLAEHKPREEEFLEPEKMRNTFFNIGRDLLQELAESRNIEIGFDELNELANILVRYTVGFGVLEVLLQDKKVQDISINSPIGQTPIFLVHEDFDECVTNLIPTREDAESWASKFRILSGRPLDEANPILDTELILPDARARVAIIQKPLNPQGLAYALRRHRDKPWTLPLFLQNKMISPLGAGLMSFLIDGSRTMLVAGTRSSGKTSLLGSVLIEIMRKYRLITIEDTLELPTDALRVLGYNIQQMKVRSALTKGGSEIAADEGIRTALRLGDSALIVGEIRSLEAFALYEAMRIGALANVVAGTIHGDSPYGVFDRVVNDLKVPKTSFKATDTIVVTNPMKSPDGLHKWRRVTQITEVRKHWVDDPLAERGFVDLMKYDTKQDMLVPTPDLMNGDSEIIKSIGGNVKEWAGDWDAIWDNILLRAKIKETLVSYANRLKNNSLLEAKFIIDSNDQFHRISEIVREEVGNLDPKRIFFSWEEWLKRRIRMRQY